MTQYDKKPNILAHGTRISDMSSISLNGLYPSNSGNLGKGVYFTLPKYAHAISCNRGQGTGVCVIHCKVDYGNMKVMRGETKDTSGKWRASYDSCYRIHGPWHKTISHNFPEWCVKANRVKIVKVELTNGTITGDLNLPGVNIHIRGTCVFKGNVLAGSLVLG